ncbi:MAG: GNAT family N-acetyltransferase [Gammaproteobacteria bacterium]|nr:GNAT family N-acetyltransferase [Gammaproteobacteria bacterium]
MKIIETERLVLRTWKDDDILPYFKINQDPKVIEFLSGGAMTMDEVKTFIDLMNQQFIKFKYTFWAIEEKSSGKLIGWIGLNQPGWQAHFTPCIEIGWRLGSEYWGKGYASEGAKAALKYGFKEIGLKEIIAFTVPANLRSIKVMEKIGMCRDLDGDFAHPKLPAGHPLSLCILYRIQK